MFNQKSQDSKFGKDVTKTSAISEEYVDAKVVSEFVDTPLKEEDINGVLQDDNEDSGYGKYVQTDYTREKIINLRVSGDSPDVSHEERKFRVKKLAGAISHSLRTSGEINVRCFGRDAISKGAKALAIARDYLKATHKHLQLNFSPAFIQTKIGNSNLTGISFCTFTFTNEPNDPQVEIETVETKLFVKADPKDTDAETRRGNVRKLAGAITHAVEENGECVVRCFGKDSIAKASKAIAIARGFVATKGSDLYCWDSFIVTEMNGNERTGICFYCFCNS